MKKLAFFAFAALALVACEKEVEAPVDAPAAKTHTVTITAGFDAETKTAYDAEGKFSWVEGDKIGVLITNGETVKQVALTAQASGASVEFKGEVEEGYELEGTASYPFTEVEDGYARNDLAWDAEKGGWRLWGSIKPSLETPLASTPLLGFQLSEDNDYYSFKTATGIVKFTVENVPADTYYAYMEIPEGKEGYLNGWFGLDADGYLKMSNPVEGWKDRYNWNAPTGVNTTMDYYFFIPVGTIPAGTKFELCNSSWAAIESFEFKQDVEVVRNAVVNIAPVKLEPATVYTLEDIIGTYEMAVTSCWINGSTQTGDLVVEKSDDATKGDIMITKFADIPGKIYGTFDGRQMVFSCDQIFGDNPFSDAADFPVLALDSYWYGTGVVDAVFNVLEPGKFEWYHNGSNGGAYDAIGFRQTTEDKWFNDDHNGGWPWAISYGSLVATWKKEAEWTSLGTGKFIDNYVWADQGFAMEPVEVEFFADPNHPGNYKIANPYAAVVAKDGGVAEGADDFFFFSVEANNQIAYERVATGLALTTNAEAKWDMISGYAVAGYSRVFDYVAATDAEGNPALINLGPCYRAGEEEIGKDHEFAVIQIAFPGVALMQKVALTAEQLTVSTDQNVGGTYTDGQSAPGLVDNSLSTYWHTPWEFIDENPSPVYGQYVDVKLDAALEGKLAFNYCTRAANQNGSPAMVVIGGSKDGENWTVLATVELGYMTQVQNSVNTFIGLPTFDAADYTYLRFGVAKTKMGADLREVATAANQKYTYLAELMLLQEVSSTVDDGGSGIPDYDPIDDFVW